MSLLPLMLGSLNIHICANRCILSSDIFFYEVSAIFVGLNSAFKGCVMFLRIDFIYIRPTEIRISKNFHLWHSDCGSIPLTEFVSSIPRRTFFFTTPSRSLIHPNDGLGLLLGEIG